MNDVRGSEANMVPVQGVTRSVEEHGAPVVLTERDCEVIAAIVLESGHKGAAARLGISASATREHMTKALAKARDAGYNAENLTDLLLALGWLRVPAR